MITEEAQYLVLVDGTDISRILHPILIRLSVTLNTDQTTDTATIDIDDTNGRIRLPRDGAEMVVMMGWASSGVAEVFRGTVDDVKSKGGRGDGMVLSIEGKSAQTKGKGKEHQDRHWDDKSLKEVLEEAAKAAGHSIKVDPSLGAMKRDWWAMSSESFYHFGSRLAREMGGSFKVYGKQAVFAKRNAGVSMSGKPLSVVRAVRGQNLINWSIAPIVGRPQFKQIEARWFDRKEAKWKRERVSVEDTKAEAVATTRFTRKDKDEAKGAAENEKADSEREKGQGTVTIDGDVGATPEGTCIVAGVRPGIDGTYRVETVTHDMDRSSGFLTQLTLKQPKGGAGTDSR